MPSYDERAHIFCQHTYCIRTLKNMSCAASSKTKSLWIQRRRLRSYFFWTRIVQSTKIEFNFFESERLSYLSDQNETKTLNPLSWIVIARTQETTDLRREEIRLREESLADGIRFPRGEDMVIHNIVQMLILLVMVETRIDIDHTHREDAVAETIKE